MSAVGTSEPTHEATSAADPQAARQVEAAYEDRWYRSMKALAAQEVDPSAAAGAGPPEEELPLDIQARAARLLERLRAMPSPE